MIGSPAAQLQLNVLAAVAKFERCITLVARFDVAAWLAPLRTRLVLTSSRDLTLLHLKDRQCSAGLRHYEAYSWVRRTWSKVRSSIRNGAKGFCGTRIACTIED